MRDKHYVGDIGIIVIVDCATVITGATGTVVKVLKPISQTIVEWPMSIEGTTKLKCITEDGDIDEKGVWKLQSYLTLGGWTGLGETACFRIYGAFE